MKNWLFIILEFFNSIDQQRTVQHQRMPTKEAGYTYAVEPVAINRLLANEE